MRGWERLRAGWVVKATKNPVITKTGLDTLRYICNARILLMPPPVTGGSLSPISKGIAADAGPNVEVSGRSGPPNRCGIRTARHQEDMRRELQPSAPILLRRRSARQEHVRPRARPPG